METQVFTEKMIREAIGTVDQNIESSIARAKKGLDTAVFVSDKKEAIEAEQLLSASDLTPTERRLIVLWPLQPNTFFLPRKE